MIGTTFAHYRITDKLGEGGMGVVYRATDTRLNRDVALKVLPEVLAGDHGRMARFQREAKVLASLNHPNVAAIHGIEEIEGRHALVLELIEGPTLKERIARGSLPVEEALPIALQIAEALEAAHEQGIIHRDLKPANIKITPAGQVKVLDFGLAKALENEPEQGSGAVLANSPTLTQQTEIGVILGTAAYMSPEQARGQPVDRRSDIWAFGVILFEMLTGQQIFAGKTVSDVLARVLEREPDWDALPSATPVQLRDLLQRTLRKDRDRRLQSICDARIAILEAQEAPVRVSPPPARHRVPSIGAAAVLLGVAALAGLAGFWWGSRGLVPEDRAPESGSILSEINLPAETPIAFGITHAFDPVLIALSPDGSSLVFVGKRSDGRSQLFLRQMNGIQVTPIPGTEDAIHPFFSPDGQWVGFLTQDRVRKVSLQGGGVITLCQAATATRATWAGNGTIYFGRNEGRFLWEVPENGGEARKITEMLSTPGVLSQILPNGRAALLSEDTGGIGQDFGRIYLLPLDTLEPRVLIEGGYDGRYVSSGHLVFARTGTLMAVRFDLAEMRIRGTPVPVLSGVRMESLFGNVQYSVSNQGTVVYSPGADAAVGRIARVDRDGKSELLPMPERVYGVFDLSPDGNELAVHVGDVENFVWIYDMERREGRRLVIPGSAGWPRWSPDGEMIASTAVRREGESLVEIRSVASPATAPRAAVPSAWGPGDWTPDGAVLSFNQTGRGIGFASTREGDLVGQLSLPDGTVSWGPTFSPDGRWVAYSSDETGQFEIWIRSFPDFERAYQVSTGGGLEPVWGKSGELFYHVGNRWMATRVATGTKPTWAPPRLVFETEYLDTPGVSYDVSADGQVLFVVKSSIAPVPNRLHVISNWFSALPQ